MADCGGTRWFDLADTATGAIRRLFLWIPPGEPPAAGWPALWLLDGNAVIGTAVDAMRAQARPGPRAPTSAAARWSRSAIPRPTPTTPPPLWDLGPPPGRIYPPFHDGGPEVRTGGGAGMARFLLGDARAFLAEELPLDLGEQALFGHSFGGLFALWLLFDRPDAFRNWIAASPAITWEDSFLLDHLARFDPADRDPRVHLSAGEWRAPTSPRSSAMAPRPRRAHAEKRRLRTAAAAAEMAARSPRAV